MIKIAICDDENKILNELALKIENSFKAYNESSSFFKTDNPIELLQHLKENSADILFLDIDMPKLSGMDIAEYLLNNDINTLLIFVTNQDALVYKSFKYHPFGFIRKSHFNEEIDSVVESAVEEIRKNSDTFSFKTGDTFCRVKITDIMYFESEANYINLHSSDKIYRFRGTLTSLENDLSSKGFIRTHKGFLVNQQHILGFKRDNIEMSNNEILPIGRTNRDIIKQTIMRYMRW